jgi:hypothetical protein
MIDRSQKAAQRRMAEKPVGDTHAVNPRSFMLVQAVLAAAAGVAGSLTPDAWFSATAGVCLAVWWGLMRFLYRAVPRSRTPPPRPRRLRADDRFVAIEAAFAAGVAVIAGAAGTIDAATLRVTREPAYGIGAGALTVMFTTLFASSLVDWYYVRPKSDGITRAPPCRSSGDDVWLAVTEIVAVLSLVTAATAAIVAAAAPPSATIPSIAGVAALGLVTLLQRAVRTLQLYAIDKPWLAIGDVLRESDGTEHYIVQIATTGIYVRSKRSGDWGRERPLALKRIEDESFEQLSIDQCDGSSCNKLNANCKWQARAAADDAC